MFNQIKYLINYKTCLGTDMQSSCLWIVPVSKYPYNIWNHWKKFGNTIDSVCISLSTVNLWSETTHKKGQKWSLLKGALCWQGNFFLLGCGALKMWFLYAGTLQHIRSLA